MGYNVEHFEGQIPTEFLCPNCRKVLDDPVLCSCRHVMCNSCFKKRVKRKRPCPVCSDTLSLNTKQLPGEWRRRLDSLQIHCIKGCDTVVLYGELSAHLENDCALVFVSCTNKECTKKVRRRDLPNHLSLCDYRVVECEGCGRQVKFISLRLHQQIHKCVQKRTMQAIVRHRREMQREVKEHRLKLRQQAFQVDREGRLLEKKLRTVALVSDEKRPTSTGTLVRAKKLLPARATRSAPGSATGKLVNNNAIECYNCHRVYTPATNHPDACGYHLGPIVSVFGGMCQNCGKLDNLEGCVRTWHLAAPPRRSPASPVSSVFLTRD